MIDFLIIGAPKSGTSWLAHNLARNPNCFMPHQEIHYYSRYFESHSPQWYAAFFADRQPGQLVGERSNTYMTDPRSPDRIQRELPDAKLIAILRNPVERAYSGYCMRLNRGFVSADISSELDPENPKAREILENGLYSVQLGRFLDRFSREQVHVALYDDILTRPYELMGDISRYLGVPTQFDKESMDRRHNEKKIYGIKPGYKQLLGPIMRSEHLRTKIIKSLRSSQWGKTMLRFFSGNLSYPPFSEAVRSRLVAYYSEEVSMISKFTGRNLDNWLAIANPAENGSDTLYLNGNDKHFLA
ncbi:MAG: sulfotransferase domain-containing protein [Sphingomonadales bacterium]